MTPETVLAWVSVVVLSVFLITAVVGFVAYTWYTFFGSDGE